MSNWSLLVILLLQSAMLIAIYVKTVYGLCLICRFLNHESHQFYNQQKLFTPMERKIKIRMILQKLPKWIILIERQLKTSKRPMVFNLLFPNLITVTNFHPRLLHRPHPPSTVQWTSPEIQLSHQVARICWTHW